MPSSIVRIMKSWALQWSGRKMHMEFVVEKTFRQRPRRRFMTVWDNTIKTDVRQVVSGWDLFMMVSNNEL
jgi:hypothetical protein